ncbi:Riboflavin biosynthesis protein [Sphingomonas antarctica]|uniref:bifunctional riboflavin kinase/FAD synthetase n=1 Tax=Sphingomonas antarctica TaxID=2040274 RepID=UPI0039ED6040
MERVTGGNDLPPQLRGAVIALGNFDGFHLGHQAVVGRAVETARRRGRPAIVATFDPHPVRYFRPDAPPFRLTSLDQRERLFAGAGADAMMVFEFNERLANVTAEDFVRDWLTHTSGVVTGSDFTFGKGRGGNVQVLAELGARQSMTVDAVAAVTLDGESVSSSRIRQALQAGDCATATRLLTRPFAVEGIVQHGDALGRTIGYPTANLSLGNYLRPRYGVYAVRVRLADGRVIDGAANLGVRPQFDPPKELLEAYLFDFDEDLYGQSIEVSLIAHLRDEAKFDGIDALVAQMDRDCDEARRILSAPAT